MDAEQEVMSEKPSAGTVMNFYGSNYSISPARVIVNNYYGDKYLDDLRRKETVDELCNLCDAGKKLYLYIDNLEMTRWCMDYLKIVDDPLQMAQIAVEMVKKKVMTKDQIVTREFIGCLKDTCQCSDKIGKGMTVDNIRKHIHNCLDLMHE